MEALALVIESGFVFISSKLLQADRQAKHTIPAVYTMEELIEFHERLIAESGYTEGSIYLQVTRGAAPRTHYFPEQVVPCLTMHIRESHSAETLAKQKAGVIAVTVPDVRWLRCDIKSLNLLGNVMAKQRAREQGAFEAIFYRDNGNITEGSSSNFMVVKDGIIWTHPANNLILNGITRRVILERLCQDLNISFVEKAFDKEFIKTVDEAFVTATTIGAMPIVKLDKDPIGNGKVGEVTQKLQAAYEDFIQKECFGKK